MAELLIGAGANRAKKMFMPERKEWTGLVTLDFNADHKPDVVHDLSVMPYPFVDNAFDEVHAYEVMEHLGKQGDWQFFFAQWSELWRILKPGGIFFGTSPHWSSPWCWMDPGHTRAMGPEMLGFLNQPQYVQQVGITPMTDYRFCYKADFDIVHNVLTEERQFQYAVMAAKPSRIIT